MENQILRNYGVIFKYFKDTDDFTQVHFIVEANYRGESREGSHYFSINRKKVFINETVPDLVIEQLAEKAGSCLYPMEISTTKEGSFHEIMNYGDIKKRWDDKKIELQNYYTGEIAEEIINSLDAIYSNKSKIEDAMKDDLFLTLFFMPIYRKHVDRIAEYKKEIAFVPFDRPITYSIVQEVDKFLTTSKKQSIVINGYSDEIAQEEATLHLIYRIDNETKSVFSIIGSVNLEKEKSKTQKIDIELYQLDEIF